jgi:dipeptidase E
MFIYYKKQIILSEKMDTAKNIKIYRNLLLISNGTLHGSGYLDHCETVLKNTLKGREVVFIPYARPNGISQADYTTKAKDRLGKMGIKVKVLINYTCHSDVVNSAEAIFIGGGNSFLLLKEMYDRRIIDGIRERISIGMPYVGTSAGANVAGRTIMTTNDMPIVYPPSFKALDLVPFIINPHYLDPNPNSTHMGETRETRIKEYHCFNEDVVIGLREGAMLRVNGENIILDGANGAKSFTKGEKPVEHETGTFLNLLLREQLK